MMMSHPLSWILAFPAAALLLVLLSPSRQTDFIRRAANFGITLSSSLSIWVFFLYDRAAGGYQFVDRIPWVSALGISYHVGLDGINSVLLLLTGICTFAAVLSSQTVKDRVKEYYAFLLLIVLGTYGAFVSLDIFVFYFLHEIATIPVFLMIGIWGGAKKEYSAMKMTLYLTAGASIALVGLIALYFASGLQTFDFVRIQEHLAAHPMPVEWQNWIFPLIVLGFGITLTMWPFYTWAPVGYAEAPTAVSMLHAGVLKKLGAYAILRFAVQLMPEGANTWMPLVANLAVLNILYCGFVCLTQRNLKYILAYSSCSHMGYILLGLACMNSLGLKGVVLLMFAHGIMAALAFALAGHVQEQAKTTDLDKLGGLSKQMPFIGTCFSMAALASAGVPGFANFVAEIMVLLAAWDQYRWQTVLAILGIVVTAIYMLNAIRLAFQGPLAAGTGRLSDATTLLQKLPYVVLLAALILVGCWPALILNNLESSIKPIAAYVPHN